MVKIWDDAMKRIFASHPQDFVRWLMPDASLVGKVSLELKTLTRTVTSDNLYKVKLEGNDALLHVEFQRSPAANMARRLWEYNVLATLEHRCPVYSFVIYLKSNKKVKAPEPPLIWALPERETIHVFRFWNIKLWELPVSALWETALPGVFPLCLLADGGKQYEVAEQVFAHLSHEKELLALALTFASMIFDDEADQPWLERKVAMLDDIIRDTWFYQKILKEGVEKGKAEGKAEGIEKGRIEGIQSVILDTIQERFPELAELTQQYIISIQDLGQLRLLHTRLIVTASVEEAKKLFQ